MYKTSVCARQVCVVCGIRQVVCYKTSVWYDTSVRYETGLLLCASVATPSATCCICSMLHLLHVAPAPCCKLLGCACLCASLMRVALALSFCLLPLACACCNSKRSLTLHTLMFRMLCFQLVGCDKMLILPDPPRTHRRTQTYRHRNIRRQTETD